MGEVLEEMGELGNSIFTSPVGCAVFAYEYLNIDSLQCAHGRPPAVATGIKRVLPDRMVITYQGDGDLPPSAWRRSSTRRPEART